MFYHNNPVLHILANECHQSVKAVADMYHIKPRQIACCSSFDIKNLFRSYFTVRIVNVNWRMILNNLVLIDFFNDIINLLQVILFTVL